MAINADDTSAARLVEAQLRNRSMTVMACRQVMSVLLGNFPEF